MWQSLAQAPESAIVALLMAERAATATYILSRLDPRRGDEACRCAAARSAQRRALRTGRAARCDAACRPADRRSGGSCVETGAGLGRRRRGPVPPRRHHQQPRSGGGGGRHASARTSPPEGRGHCQNDALFLQRSAETVRAGAGAPVRPGVDRHRRHGPAGDRRGFPRHCSLVDALARPPSGRGRTQFRRRSRRLGMSPKARKAIADIVLGMASRNEIELGGRSAAAEAA